MAKLLRSRVLLVLMMALAVVLPGRLVFGARPPVADEVRPPNILLVIADDFGVDASPCYDTGTDKPMMPTLSRLCREGLVFDRFWTAPECSPTRASILTGRYGFRTGIGTAVTRQDVGLSTEELSLQTFITQSGIRMTSAVIGKWHLASDANGWADHPSRMGVSHYVGLLTGTVQNYSRWSRTENGQTQTATSYITTALTAGGVEAPIFGTILNSVRAHDRRTLALHDAGQGREEDREEGLTPANTSPECR